jgi:hypothetical protein
VTTAGGGSGLRGAETDGDGDGDGDGVVLVVGERGGDGVVLVVGERGGDGVVLVVGERGGDGEGRASLGFCGVPASAAAGPVTHCASATTCAFMSAGRYFAAW